MARCRLSLAQKFSMRWRAWYKILSYGRRFLRLALGGITASLPACSSGPRTRSSASNALSAISVTASSPGSRASAPSRSCACPGESANPVGLPSASTLAWILVVSPPLLRPIASAAPLFCGPGAVLMGADDGAVDHRPLVVGVIRQVPENPFPCPGLRPAAEAGVHLLPRTEPLRQIAPGDAGAVVEEHRLNKQAVVLRGDPDVPLTAGQQVLDPLPLVVTQ